jgi:hypothetical protein
MESSPFIASIWAYCSRPFRRGCPVIFLHNVPLAQPNHRCAQRSIRSLRQAMAPVLGSDQPACLGLSSKPRQSQGIKKSLGNKIPRRMVFLQNDGVKRTIHDRRKITK